MLELVKLALRRKSAAFDEEIQNLIDAAVADLRAAGIDAAEDTTNPRIKQAIVLYCKGNFGMTDESVERFREHYEMLRIALALDTGEATP